MPWHSEHFLSKTVFVDLSAGSEGSGAIAGPEAHVARNGRRTQNRSNFFISNLPFGSIDSYLSQAQFCILFAKIPDGHGHIQTEKYC